MTMSSPTHSREDLLRAAVRCYLGAGRVSLVKPLLHQLGDWHRLAELYRADRDWPNAGECYERAQAFTAAADCFEEAQAHQAAARCLIRARRFIEAAWITAHYLDHPTEAEQVLRKKIAQPQGEVEELAWNVVVSRCLVGREEPEEATRILSTALERQQQPPAVPLMLRVKDWALVVASSLERPDLAVRIHVRWHSAEPAKDAAHWEQWANEALGARITHPRDQRTKPLVGEEPSVR